VLNAPKAMKVIGIQVTDHRNNSADAETSLVSNGRVSSNSPRSTRIAYWQSASSA